MKLKIDGMKIEEIFIKSDKRHKEAELLILDEATSALDYATEDSLMKVIDFLDKKITVIIISHRISFLKNCTYFIRL